MQNTYQDLITDIQSKNPEISGKLEGGKKFKLVTNFKPAGDQPEAVSYTHLTLPTSDLV